MIFQNFPILDLLIRPRQTCRRLLDLKKYPKKIPIAILIGLEFGFIMTANVLDGGFLITLINHFLLGVFAYLFWIILMKNVYYFTAKNFGGLGKKNEIEAITIWSFGIDIAIIIPNLLFFLIFALGDLNIVPLFQGEISHFATLAYILLNFFARLYNTFLLVVFLSETNNLSIIKSILIHILSTIFLIILVFLIVPLVSYLMEFIQLL